MAVSFLRLRRSALSLSAVISNHLRAPLCSSTPPPPQLLHSATHQNPSLDLLNSPSSQLRGFRSSNVSLAARPRAVQADDTINPGDILFEGCDYFHWLITVDFPKDPKPTPEQMVETYVQIAAQVFGSVEEAKQKIYACSTTTYQGFQVECSEDISKKFEGLPGVVFVLPDSYIDPVNKEYGGDKYINGQIIPRQPPVQFGRTGGRFGDRNREYNRPRENRPRGEYQQGNMPYNNQGSMQGNVNNFGTPQNPPLQQNYGPRAGGGRDFAPPINSPGGQGNQGYSRDQAPTYQGNFNQGQRGNYYPQGERSPPPGGNFGQGASQNYGQGDGSNYRQVPGGNYGQDAGGDNRQVAGGNYGQSPGGNYRQGVTGTYEQGGNQRFSQAEQMSDMDKW